MLYYLCRLFEEQNLNNSFYDTLNKNFNYALELYQKILTHEEIIRMLNEGNTLQKQIAAIKLNSITCENDADALIKNLTGQDGKVREVVAFRLNEFLQKQELHKFFLKRQNYNIFLDATVDINGNICRNTISAISNLKIYPDFCNYFCSALVDLTNKLISIVEKFDFQDGKYKVNKEVFKLYWCLETLSIFTNCVNFDILKEILLKSKDIEEYTIREKTAKILSNIICDEDLSLIKKQLKKDSNYYVRRF